MSWAADVLRIAREATAHNSGGTIVSFRLLAIEEVDDLADELALEMSSWPRMREAETALEHAGYDVDQAENVPSTLWVRVGSNAPPTSREPEVVEAWLRS